MSVNDNVFKNITFISVRQYDAEKRCKIYIHLIF